MFSDVAASSASVSCLCLVLVSDKLFKPAVLRGFLFRVNRVRTCRYARCHHIGNILTEFASAIGMYHYSFHTKHVIIVQRCT